MLITTVEMGRSSLYFALFSVTFIVLDLASATKQEDVYRLKRSPQMPQMPQPPSPPEGFPSPPSMPFRRAVRQLTGRHFRKDPRSSFHPRTLIIQWSEVILYPQARTQRHVQGVNLRSKREARGTGGKFPNRGG
nr:uncharacterized protein LOC109399894 [Aedes albopictus]